MKLITITTCIMGITLAACNNAANTSATATDSVKKADSLATTTPPPPPQPDSATAAKNWQAYMTPGPMHKMMAGWNGNWKSDISMWMKPGDSAIKTTGQATNKMILNGLYQQSTHSSNMMGMPFNGMGIFAYDNAKKIFINSWIDNMGSGIMELKGPWDESSKTITLTGKMVEPATGAEIEVKETFKLIDNDNQLMEMFAPGPDGKEYRTMEIKLTRKK